MSHDTIIVLIISLACAKGATYTHTTHHPPTPLTHKLTLSAPQKVLLSVRWLLLLVWC